MMWCLVATTGCQRGWCRPLEEAPPPVPCTAPSVQETCGAITVVVETRNHRVRRDYFEGGRWVASTVVAGPPGLLPSCYGVVPTVNEAACARRTCPREVGPTPL
jgi:hypothetical protein